MPAGRRGPPLLTRHRRGRRDGAEAALEVLSLTSIPASDSPAPARPLLLPGRHSPWALLPCIACPPWSGCRIHRVVRAGAWGRAGAGDSWHPRDGSVSPAESSLRCSRFSMVLLCSLLEAS